MSLSRDRVTRPIDLAEVFARRRSGPMGILSDEAMEILGVSRMPMGVVTTTTTTTSMARGGELGRGSHFGTPRSGIRRGRNLYRTPAPRRENTPATGSAMGPGRGRGGMGRSSLPSWYPRTPLRDITAILRAIERRRARLGEGEGQTTESPSSQDEMVLNLNVSSGAHLEDNFSTPATTAKLKLKPCPSSSVRSVSKILLDVTTKKGEEAEFLTPQKKLLNSIDTVEKIVMEELQRMKRTPSAKKAERQMKVRTLMSMR